MSDLLRKCLRRYDPLHHGLDLRGIAQGMHLAHGRVFPRVDGGYSLLRGRTRGTIDADSPVGAAPAHAAAIEPFGWIGHAPGVYLYELVGVGPGGVESVRDPANVVKVTVEDDGAIEPVPPAPRDLAVTPLAGGVLRVTWRYTPSPAFARAAAFAIYTDGGGGTIDLDTPAEVRVALAARLGEGVYAWDSEPFAHGTEVQYLVRARTSDEREELNAITASGVADAEGPDAAAVVDFEYGADE